MQELQTRHSSGSNQIKYASPTGSPFGDLKERQLKILIANSNTNLLETLNKSGIFPEKSNKWSYPLTCPFPHHKNGNESTPSFGYNFDDDRFYCFGCKSAGRSVEFISFLEEIDKDEVANKILANIEDNAELYVKVYSNPRKDIKEELVNFAISINNVLLKNKNNKKIVYNVEKILWWFNSYLHSYPNLKLEELSARVSKALEFLKDYE